MGEQQYFFPKKGLIVPLSGDAKADVPETGAPIDAKNMSYYLRRQTSGEGTIGPRPKKETKSAKAPADQKEK
jgi:hypothetical protein